MGLLTLLTDPKNFNFYNGGQGYTGNGSIPNLKNLPYGNDRIYNGNSKQPYITYSIDNGAAQLRLSGTPLAGFQSINLSANVPNGLTNLDNWNNDFLLRGGTRAVTDSAIDVVRLTKWFTSSTSPNGLFFTVKQDLLSRSAVRTQTSSAGGGKILNGGIYSPLNTLTQAGVVAFGTHLNKQGLNPFQDTGISATTNENLYSVRVKPDPNNPDRSINENRLARLYNLSSSNLKSKPLAGTGIILNSDVDVLSYPGGPGSFLGVGRTNIRYALGSQTFLTKSPTSVTAYNNSNTNTNVFVYDSKTLKFESPVAITNTVLSPVTQDFRATLRNNLNKGFVGPATPTGTSGEQTGQLANSLSYFLGDNQTIEGRVNLGNPGDRAGKSYAYYDKGVTDSIFGKSIYGSINVVNNNSDFGSFNPGLDKINSLPVYRSNAVIEDPVANDLIQFRIAIIDNDSPAFKTFIHFRAFLDTITDSYNANWNGFQYLGRGEQFYTYNGFTRQISLSWTVAAQSKEELIPMYKKLNYLASSLTPDYSSNGYMRGNLAQLTIGGYVYEQPGIITAFDYTMDENTPWEIGIGTSKTDKEDGTVKELAHVIKVSGFTFIPIQRFRPEIQELTYTLSSSLPNEKNEPIGFPNYYGDQRYISIANGERDKNSNYNYSNTNKTGKITIGNLEQI